MWDPFVRTDEQSPEMEWAPNVEKSKYLKKGKGGRPSLSRHGRASSPPSQPHPSCLALIPSHVLPSRPPPLASSPPPRLAISLARPPATSNRASGQLALVPSPTTAHAICGLPATQRYPRCLPLRLSIHLRLFWPI